MSTGPRKVAILFLAHDGIVNPHVWEQWLFSDNKYTDRVVVGVFRNRQVTYESDFCKQYDLHIDQVTGWCEFGIALATIEGLRRLFDHDPLIDTFYVVSGYCLPVQELKYLFVNRANPMGTRSMIDPQKSIVARQPCPDILSKVCRHIHVPGKSLNPFCHIQWMALSRQHTQALVSLPQQSLTSIIDILKTEVAFEYCPDEYLIGTLLNTFSQLRSFHNSYITDQGRKTTSSPSPVVWSGDMSERQTLAWPDDSGVDGVLETITFREFVDRAKEQGFLFVRKVAQCPSLQFMDIQNEQTSKKRRIAYEAYYS
jgi:hypothetical protein